MTATPLHSKTTFAQVPDVATQIGYIVEAWTYVERLLRDVMIYASPKDLSQDLIASRLFHLGDIGGEINETLRALREDGTPKAQKLAGILERLMALLPDRNAIIHGWFAGPTPAFPIVELVHFQRLKGRAGPRDLTTEELYRHRNHIEEAPAFLENHMNTLRALFMEGVATLHPEAIEPPAKTQSEAT